MSQTMRQYVTLASWGTSFLRMENQLLVTYMYPSPWKRIVISLEIPFLHLILSWPLIRCQYYWAFPVFGHMTAFALPSCKVISPVAWSITSQSSPSRLTRGAGLLGADVGVLMVATWFYMRYCPWIRCYHVLYLCSCGTLGATVDFWCAAGGMVSVSLGMMWVACRGAYLGARPGKNDMSPCGSTLGGFSGATSDVSYGVVTLRGGVTCGGGGGLLKISDSCLRATVCFPPNSVSGIVGVGLRGAWVRSETACVAASFDEILDNVSVAGGNYVVSDNLSLSVLGM